VTHLFGPIGNKPGVRIGLVPEVTKGTMLQVIKKSLVLGW